MDLILLYIDFEKLKNLKKKKITIHWGRGINVLYPEYLIMN